MVNIKTLVIVLFVFGVIEATNDVPEEEKQPLDAASFGFRMPNPTRPKPPRPNCAYKSARGCEEAEPLPGRLTMPVLQATAQTIFTPPSTTGNYGLNMLLRLQFPFKGPSSLPIHFPPCGGNNQSPINIVTTDATGNYSWTHFNFYNCDAFPTAMTIINNGHSAQGIAEMSSPATLQGGDLNGQYTFLTFEFHWGSDDTKGSEHTVDGNRYPSELHLIHFKTSYGNVEEAIKHADGLAVLGVFLDISGSDNIKLNSIINGLANIHKAYSSSSIVPFALQDLLPANVHDFYRYHGSLTTPTCNEVVTLTVFKEPITISSTQIAKFRELMNREEHEIVNNFRPLQPLNGRKVYKGLASGHWSYHGKYGPSYWPISFLPCGGMRQSPINIVRAHSSGNYPWSHLHFHHYDVVPTAMNITNNGHSAQVAANISSPATIQRGGLNGQYTFHRLHFHWGSDETKGSEHTVDDNRYPGELHLVHFKTEYGSVQEAIKYADGLAVLGVFLDLSGSDNDKLSSIISGLTRIHEVYSLSSIVPFALQDLLPANVHDFYRYHGSLTTPTCNEVVTWTVFEEPITISSTQMAKFRELLDEEGHEIVDNFRPVQPLNRRKVYEGLSSPHWSYHGIYGPSHWPVYFAICGGLRQSPINIVTADIKGSYSWTHFNFHFYDAIPTAMTITNNEHSAQVETRMSSPATVEGGNLKGQYTFLQFHFHWGSDDTKGSEHTIDEHRYSSELHLVHFKTEYGCIEEAIKHADGLAVLAVFLVISQNDNQNLNSIINGLENIHETFFTSSVTPFKLQDLLPANLDNFYGYQGSLTTPTCNEVVTWTVFKEPISISSTQMAKFRELMDEEEHNIVNNFRPVQLLNGRNVTNYMMEFVAI